MREPEFSGAVPEVPVGREQELGRLDGLIADAARGRGQVMVVRAEAGIGKTRLVREALGRCERAGFVGLIAAAEEMEQRRPFGVIADALALERARDPEGMEIRALLRGGGGGGGALADGALVESRDAELTLEHVEGLCAGRRVALVIEDLHWADPSSLLVVHRLAHAAAGCGCCWSARCGRIRSVASCARCWARWSAPGRGGWSSGRSTSRRCGRWWRGLRARRRAPR